MFFIKGLQLRENIKKGVFVDGLIEQVVGSAAEAYQVNMIINVYHNVMYNEV